MTPAPQNVRRYWKRAEEECHSNRIASYVTYEWIARSMANSEQMDQSLLDPRAWELLGDGTAKALGTEVANSTEEMWKGVEEGGKMNFKCSLD